LTCPETTSLSLSQSETTLSEGRLDEEPAGTPPSQIGRYLLLDPIGEGGMGIVYAAWDPRLDRRVALKVLRHGPKLPLNAQPRLLREAQALARLSHPNVVEIFDVGVIDDQVFLAMALVDGAPLHVWQRQPRRWTEILAAYIQAGRGLAAAHRERLVHRDFKPHNVLIDNEGRVRVLDFGLAVVEDDETLDTLDPDTLTAASRLTMTGVVMGTPAYMSPEQLTGDAIEPASDQFSFCVALYEALFGHRPFAGRSVRELSYATHRGDIIAPRSDHDVPGWVRSAIARGLSADPDDRWSSMTALLRNLDPEVRRRRRSTVLGAGLALSVAAGAFGMHARSAAQPPCHDAGEPIANAWDDDARRTMKRQMLATDLPYAKQTWSRVSAALDEYSAQWTSARAETCAGIEQDAGAAVDLQIQCLDERLTTFTAVVDVLERADADTVRNATRAVSKLPAVARCLDEEALVAIVPPPSDHETALEVDAVRGTLAAIRALELAGHYPEAQERIDNAVAAAETTGYRPVQAEALLLQGQLEERLGHYERAAKLLTEAAMLAREIGHVETAATGFIHLSSLTGYLLAQKDEGLRWSRHAHAMVERGHLDRTAHVRMTNAKAAILFRAGDYDGARTSWERAVLDLDKPVDRGEQLELAGTHNNLGNTLARLRNLEDAERHLERAYALTADVRGDEHPDSAIILANLANVYLDRGKFDMAIESHSRALEVRRATLPEQHPHVATSEMNLGVTYSSMGDPAKALTHLERAVAIKEAAVGPEHPDVALALNNLGETLRDLGRIEEAIASHERARDIWETIQGQDHPFVAFPQTNLGLDHLEAGNIATAERLLEEGIALCEEGRQQDAGLLALARLGLARVLVAQGRDLERARSLAQFAADTLAGTHSARFARDAEALVFSLETDVPHAPFAK